MPRRRRPEWSSATTAGGQRGAVAVEFALIVPILLLLVFGAVNFGIVLAQKASLASAARAGARFGAVNAYTASHSCANVVAKVRDNAQTIGIGATNNKEVVVSVYQMHPDGSSSLMCKAGKNLDTSVATAPCTDAAATAAAPDNLKVDVSFDSGLIVPVPGLGNGVSLTNSATYLCEYHS